LEERRRIPLKYEESEGKAMANAITDLVLAQNLSTIPREFFPEYEERIEWESPSPIPNPLEYLLAREEAPAKNIEIEEGYCILPSRYFIDDGIYVSYCPQAVIGAVVKDDARAYVSPQLPAFIIREDCHEILPKFVPIRRHDKPNGGYESHGKRGRHPRRWQNERTTIRRITC